MSKNKIVFAIGFILLLMPFLGFPSSWENFLSFMFGLVLVAMSFSVAAKRRATTRRSRRPRKAAPAEFFVDGGREQKQEETVESMDVSETEINQ
jgi:hypothetical protein